MREQLEQRLKELRQELESGQRMMADLEARQSQLRETMLRISGAIQVIEEELGKSDGATQSGLAQPDDQAHRRSSKGNTHAP